MFAGNGTARTAACTCEGRSSDVRTRIALAGVGVEMQSQWGPRVSDVATPDRWPPSVVRSQLNRCH